MKTLTKYRSLFIALSLTAFSCDEFLDVQPKDSLSTSENIIDSKSTAESALRGVYSALGNDGYYGTSFQSIGYLSGDNIVWTGSQSQVQEFINHKVNAENSTISSAWNAIYRTINRANNLIASVPKVQDPALTDALRNQYLGEAYFIRALGYFDLARTWGGVPVVTFPTLEAGDNVKLGKSTVDEVYAQVLSDLNEAEQLLPETVDRFRATKKTAWALKARYYLYRKDYILAEEYATKLIGDTKYKLLKPYNSFFAANARGTEESIFEIFYNGSTEVNGHRNQWQPQTNGGTRQWAPNDALVSLLSDPAKGGSRNTLVGKDNQNRWFGNLYYRSPASDPSYVFRIAEIYLIRAEARAQLEKLIDGVADLNAVRDRAGLAAIEVTTKDELLLAIENERRLEFALEPHRWFDLVRTERADDVLNVTESFRLVMPIPASQILVDDAIEQNEGY